MSVHSSNSNVQCKNSGCLKGKLAKLGLIGDKPAIFLWCKSCRCEVGYSFEDLMSKFEECNPTDRKLSELSRNF